MPFRAGELRVFDRSGRPIGSLSGWSLSGPPSYRLNETEDFAFTLARNDGAVPLITSSTTPVLVGSTTAQSAGTCSANHPRAAATNDVLVAVLSYNANGSAAVRPVTPLGWRLVAHSRRANSLGVAVFVRRLASGDPASTSFSITGSPTICQLTLLAYRGPSGFATDLRIIEGSSATNLTIPRPVVPEAGTLTFVAVADWGGAALTATSGGHAWSHYQQHANLITAVGGVIESAAAEAGSPLVSTAAASTTYAGVAVTFEPSASVSRMLRRDNLVFVEWTQPGMRGWGGAITKVDYADGGASVSCSGIASLLSGVGTTAIEQDEGVAATVAKRLVEAAAAKKAAHGDLMVGFQQDGTRPLYGKFTYEGDVLAGLQQLAERTVSEFWTESWVGSDGWLKARLHWDSLISIDKTGVVLPSGGLLALKDGVGGNLTPGTQVSFSGAERVNRARLLGSPTNISEHLDYPSVMGLFADIVPEATVTIPEKLMPGSRRREMLDLSVDWGLTRDTQKGLAQQAQNTYLDHYKRFLYAYHARFGSPFLEGYDWSGPEPDQFAKLSQRNFRTITGLGFIGQRDVVTNWDPDGDADVTLEGWHFTRYITELPGQTLRGVAQDFTDPRYRWMAFDTLAGRSGMVASVRAEKPHDVEGDSVWQAVRPGEGIRGVSSSPVEPNTVWVLTVDDSGSWVRSWDVADRQLISEWRTSVSKHSGLAVDVAAGVVWMSRTDSGALEKRDLNGGALLESFATGVASGTGVSVSGPVAYVAAASGRIEMRFTKDGARAGSKDLDFGVGVMFVDPLNSEVWLVESGGSRNVRLYSASIAVDEVGDAGPVDGAPGFPAISRGRFVRIVMADTRDIGEPPESGQKGLIPVLHRNQHGRYTPSGKAWLPESERAGQRWTEWPDSWGRSYNRQNCSWASGAMLLDRHTRGAKRKTPPQMREAAGDRAGRNNFAEQSDAWKAFGEDFNYSLAGKWSDCIERLREGRGILLKTDFDGIPEKYRCQSGYRGDHALYLHRLLGDTIQVHDPLCRASKKIPIEHVKRAAGIYVSARNGQGKADFGWSRDTTRKTQTPGTQGTARSFFVVWSEGKWTDEVSPGGPGQASVTTRRWDPGEQKKGFKERSKVTIANPAQVIHGEEGRVADWNPTTMGYGRSFTDANPDGSKKVYYQTKGGDKRWSQGWHLVPWDIPLSTFTLVPPAWPEGEAYLRNLLERYNREQGAQTLGVVNLDSVWTHITLGGVYSLNVSLQGPDGGIVGKVRVVQFSPDPNNGVMQVMAEWVG